MILGMDYKFRDEFTTNKTDTTAMEILSGPYTGVVFRFTKVSVKIDADKDVALLTFAYDILDSTKSYKEKALIKDKKFQEHIGVILNVMILEISDMETEINNALKEKNANRESDFKQSIE